MVMGHTRGPEDEVASSWEYTNPSEVEVVGSKQFSRYSCRTMDEGAFDDILSNGVLTLILSRRLNL